MCASPVSDDQFELVRPPAGSKLGERIKLEGNPIPNFSEDRQDELKNKKKHKE